MWVSDDTNTPATQQRKSEHLRINLEEDVRGRGITTGFADYRFVHYALPNLDLASIQMHTTFLGHSLRVPLLISCMTGGTTQAAQINARLAAAAAEVGCAMGVGSQRAALEDEQVARSFQVREVAPGVPLFANLGAVQLNYGYGVDHCRRAVEMIDAQVLVLHLNPLQEALQEAGNTNFGGLLGRIGDVCRALDVPVVVKEVGWGITADVARALLEVGVAAIDVAGAGGTSWSEVERYRAPTPLWSAIASGFADWGIPTADCLVEVRRALPTVPLIASGGVQTGVDMAKALALGADLVGIAGPLLRAAALSPDATLDAVRAVVEQLRVSMFCLNAASLAHLRGTSALRRVSTVD